MQESVEKSLQNLEFPKILSLLAGYAKNESVKDRIRSLKPSSDLAAITKELDVLEEAVEMELRNGAAPVTAHPDITSFIDRAKIDSTLSMEELLIISDLLQGIKNLISYYREDDEETLLLDPYFKNLDACVDLKKEIDKKIISPTEMDDHASARLFEIRKQKDIKERMISTKLEQIVGSSKNEKYLQEQLVSMRNGRYVVPVKASYKSQIPGVVLDRSSTGQTLFIEPLVVVELNNEIRELEIEEQKEIQKILSELTKRVKGEATELQLDQEVLNELDFLFAKSAYALDSGATKVKLTQKGEINLKKAVHPLLDKETAVSSDIVIPQDQEILVITGPNTGGKTVTLKTIGLLSLMVQSGLFIPVREGSTTRIFSKIFADIGDEQSIEQNLSTFSAHMKNIVQINENADENSLVLFDELGAGTDPVEGAALAISLLRNLKEKTDFIAATTHYPQIKEYALREDDVLNASMEFDIDSLEPTYRLIIGLPGKSNAFEIAKRLGLDEKIVEDGRGYIGTSDKELEETLSRAQDELKRAKEEKEEADRLLLQSQELNKKATQKYQKLRDQETKIIKEAKKNAQKIIDSTKKETDQIYKEIQKIQREQSGRVDNKKLEALRRDLNEISDKNLRQGEYDSNKVYKISDFKKGDRVYIKNLGQEADIVEIYPKDKRIEVASGTIRMKLKASDLVPVKKKKVTHQPVVSSARPNFPDRLDLRGKTYEEAKLLTDEFVLEAYAMGKNKVEIIHGFGTGQVRKAVHDSIRKMKNIRSFRLGGPGEGGAGATIIEF